MRYYTFLNTDEEQVVDYPMQSVAVFPATRDGTDALRQYGTEFCTWGKKIAAGSPDANLYMFEAPEAIDLPFEMNLNYTDVRNAKTLSDENLEKAIEVISQYDAGHIINTGDYYDFDSENWEETPHAHKHNHSREHLIFILSSIAKTLGSVVASEKEGRGQHAMASQVLVTIPVKMVKVPQEQAAIFLQGDDFGRFQSLFGRTNVNNQQVIGRVEPEEDDEEEDTGEFGMGGDWWKNPQEAIRRLSELIDEDLV